MCDHCDLIDYPVADCWRKCYVPRPKPKGWIPPTPRGGFSDANGAAWDRITELVGSLNQKQAEIERLKAQAHHHTDSRDSLEGVE